MSGPSLTRRGLRSGESTEPQLRPATGLDARTTDHRVFSKVLPSIPYKIVISSDRRCRATHLLVRDEGKIAVLRVQSDLERRRLRRAVIAVMSPDRFPAGT
jgi:hypothetical protein